MNEEKVLIDTAIPLNLKKAMEYIEANYNAEIYEGIYRTVKDWDDDKNKQE